MPHSKLAIRILWTGAKLPPSVRDHLIGHGVVLQEGPEPPPVAEVVAGRSFPDRRPGDRPCVWFAQARPADEVLTAAIAAGAYDVVCASDAEAPARLLARLRELAVPSTPLPKEAGLVMESAAGRRLAADLAHAARTSMPVLLTGETGTGKEVSARLLHRWSGRRDKRFVPINCAAIPNDLLESELFGHAKGAFSGAVQHYDGQLAAAEGGTVLLDEVDDTPLSFQVKLLRVLEDRVISRLGENQWRKVDFRILAATNRDLRALIAKGMFGADLFERLAIVSIRLPPLRERREDIPALAQTMVARFYDEEPTARDRHHVRNITPEALSVFQRYAWPGNIRELRNVVFGALVRKRAGTELLVSDLPARLLRSAPKRATTIIAQDVLGDAIHERRFNLRDAVEALERAALEIALARTGGNAAAAAELLGQVGRGVAKDPGATVRAMMKRLAVGENRR